MRPKQRDKEGETFSKSLKFWEIHSNMPFQKFWVYLQVQNRWTRVSFCSLQKEQESVCLIPILYRKAFVAIFLWRNLNWNALSFDSFVHRDDCQYVFSPDYCYSKIKMYVSLSSNHFPWLLNGIEGLWLLDIHKFSWKLWCETEGYQLNLLKLSHDRVLSVLSCNVLQQISLCDIQDSWFGCYIYLWRRYSLENSGRYLTSL